MPRRVSWRTIHFDKLRRVQSWRTITMWEKREVVWGQCAFCKGKVKNPGEKIYSCCQGSEFDDSVERCNDWSKLAEFCTVRCCLDLNQKMTLFFIKEIFLADGAISLVIQRPVLEAQRALHSTRRAQPQPWRASRGCMEISVRDLLNVAVSAVSCWSRESSQCNRCSYDEFGKVALLEAHFQNFLQLTLLL